MQVLLTFQIWFLAISGRSPYRTAKTINMSERSVMIEEKEKSWKDSVAEKARIIAEKTASVASKTSDSISNLSSDAWEISKDSARDIVDFTEKGIKKAWESTTETFENIALQGKVKFKDDVDMIRQGCSILNNITTTSSPALFQSLLYASAGMGLLSNEIELARLSRDIMDVNGSPQQILIEMMFGKTHVTEISRWMDSAPGFKTIGGGWTHRIQHGHDISALVQLAQNHNIAGVSEWLNHVVLRDFWTPSGVPYLPAGSSSMYNWLTSQGVGKMAASKILSINAWQVMGLIMVYRSSKKMYKLIREQIDNRKARQLFDRGQELEIAEDFIAANECYDRVLGYSMESPDINLWFAMKFFHMGQQETQNELTNQHFLRCYNTANGTRLRLTEDRTIPYQGGIEISLRGMLTTIMASSWMSISQDGNSDAIKGAIASGVDDLIKMANKLKDNFLDRPFSAMANEVLALKLLMSAPFDIPTSQTPLTIRSSIFNTLNELAMEGGNRGAYAKTLIEGIERQYPLEQQRIKLIETV